MTLTYIVLGMLAIILLAVLKSRFADFMAQTPDDYGDGPIFDIQRVLDGPIACEGVIYGPLGRVSSRFSAEMEAEWTGNVGVLREHFTYDSGATQDREWTLKVNENGQIEATAPDVIGIGDGQQRGSAVRLKYRIRLTEDAGGHVLDTTDWMYLTPNGHIVNRSQFRKFGFKVAELVATMRPIRRDQHPGE